MFLMCLVVKLIVHTPVVSIIAQITVGVLTYIGMLILFKDKFLNTIIETVKAKLASLRPRPQE